MKPVELAISHFAVLHLEDYTSVVILTASLVPDYSGYTLSYPFREVTGVIFEASGRVGKFSVTQMRGLFAAVGLCASSSTGMFYTQLMNLIKLTNYFYLKSITRMFTEL